MTNFATRLPTLSEVREQRVSPSVAQRRANGVRPGRALSPRELDDVAALFPELRGATNVNDLNSYQAQLLGVRGPSAYDQHLIDEAEDRRAQPWAGGYDSEVATRQGRTFVGYDASDHVYGRGSY